MKSPSLLPLIFFTSVLSFLTYGQEVSLKTILPSSIQETSGLIKIDGKLITHNDSGSKPELYEFDDITGAVTRIVTVKNATNIDWEDLANDDDYIYIGDFGNNFGNRRDLKVYRIPITDYLGTTDDTVEAEEIKFKYSEQTDFSSNAYATNFDAEALIAYKDVLYLFTKNWVNSQTNIYALSKSPGTYEISSIGSINAQGFVTGADYNQISNTLILTGYAPNVNFIIEIRDFNATNFSNGNIRRYTITPPNNTSTQIESILSISEDEYYLTSESYQSKSPALIKLNSKTLSINDPIKKPFILGPNPSEDMVTIQGYNFLRTKIYDLKGQFCKEVTGKEIYIGDLNKGTYLFYIKEVKSDKYVIEKIIKN
ncbi:T9SS C-terminal target domain-containing protein [Tenacibaculum maritimum]|uniref:T9SS C-terminal target domain-containing protein n=1 Tax=Tenacibaculum maritimum TaxID=107401 RepID=UPI003890DB7B